MAFRTVTYLVHDAKKLYMKNLLYFSLLFAFGLLTMSSCNKDEDDPAKVRMEFTATVGNQDYAPFTDYTYYNGEAFTINKVVFYISSIDLVKSNGSTERISDIEYVDLSDPVEPGKSVFTFNDIPSGDYTAIRFGIGVPSDMNAKTPADFGVEHPLAIESMYWDAWDSYIFSKTEGRIDTTGNGETDQAYLYHTGIDDLYRGLEATRDFELKGGEEKLIQFNLDVLKLFGSGNDYIDIKAKPMSHNPADLDIATEIMDNYVTALTFSF